MPQCYSTISQFYNCRQGSLFILLDINQSLIFSISSVCHFLSYSHVRLSMIFTLSHVLPFFPSIFSVVFFFFSSSPPIICSVKANYGFLMHLIRFLSLLAFIRLSLFIILPEHGTFQDTASLLPLADWSVQCSWFTSLAKHGIWELSFWYSVIEMHNIRFFFQYYECLVYSFC